MSGRVFEFLVASTLLMALVLAARPLARRWCGSGGTYSLWLIPLVLSVMAFLPDAHPGPNLLEGAAPVELMMTSVAQAEAGFDTLIWPWAAGALLFAGWQLVLYRRFLHRALDGAERLNASGTPVFATDAVDGPAAAGLHEWRIFVPRDFEERFTPAERKLALRHELRHLTAAHLQANAAALVMVALHWFNPLAWRAYRAFRVDQELSCDEAVIAASEADERATYGAAMIKAAGRGGRTLPATACPMARNRTLKRRLSMIKTHRTFKRPLARTLAAYAIVTGAGVMLTATTGIAAEPVAKTEKIIVKRFNKGDGMTQENVAAAIEEAQKKCGGKVQSFEARSDAREKGEAGTSKLRFVMCNKDGERPVDQLAALERARASLANSNEVPGPNRAKILEALDGAIAKLKAQ